MNATLSHLSLRLWLTAFTGGLACTVVLPQWQRLFGMSLIVLPVLVVLCICFFLLGWLMNQLGVRVIRRQVAEAAVWERAGMNMEAEAVFEQAKSAYDSFWLSPVKRRQIASWITQRLARFYLVQPASDRNGQAMVMSYLMMRPQDHAVAKGWLEAALHRERHTREEHDLAGRIAEALTENDDIQILLMQFFLANGRMDFEAMQTYRRVWGRNIPGPLVKSLAKLLLNEAYIDDWALQVYLKAYSLGVPSCIEGVAAGVHLLRPNEDNRKHLALAKDAVSQLVPSEQLQWARQFGPRQTEDLENAEAGSGNFVVGVQKKIVSFGQFLSKRLRAASAKLAAKIRQLPLLWRQRPSIRNAAVIAILLCMCSALVITAWHMFRPSTTPAPEPGGVTTQPSPEPVTDPFTIQVAAYLSSQDAQRFVARLNSNGVDAFFTKANSLNRTWYQVKVSHFASKEEAGKYGEMLKSKGLIDDYYVANYNGR